jgi:hypothetical protein
MVKSKKTTKTTDELSKQPLNEDEIFKIANPNPPERIGVIVSPEQPIEANGRVRMVLPGDSGTLILAGSPVASEEAKPAMQTDLQLAQENARIIEELVKVLDSVPRPEFFKWEDAVSYQDRWAAWIVQMKLTKNRLNL